MGEKIKNIGEFKLGDKTVLIELNEGYDINHSKYDIHIQSEHVQYCLSNKEYVQLASTLINAKEKLDFLKSYEKLGNR